MKEYELLEIEIIVFEGGAEVCTDPVSSSPDPTDPIYGTT